MATDKAATRATAKANEFIGGREVTWDPRTGVPSFVGAEETSEEELTVLRMLDSGPRGGDFEHQTKQNKDLLFWKPEVQLDKAKAPVPNPIRGFVMAMFERPAEFNTGDSEDEDELPESGLAKPRIACFVFTTLPTHVIDRNKDIRLAPIGTMVWVDLNQSTASVVRLARPVMGDNGDPTSVAEVGIQPLFKRPFQSRRSGKTLQAWQTNVFGGRGATAKKEGYRAFNAQQIAALGEKATIPALMNLERAAIEIGIRKAPEPRMLEARVDEEVPALPPASDTGAPALPAHASPN